MKQTLTTSEINTLIAALMLTAIQYDKEELKKAHPNEAEKYRNLEYKFRNLCYDGENTIATLECSAIFPKKEVLAVCDKCGRDIMDDEVALNRAGIYCFDCCQILWGVKEEK